MQKLLVLPGSLLSWSFCVKTWTKQSWDAGVQRKRTVMAEGEEACGQKRLGVSAGRAAAGRPQG